jgi:NAD(P)-dependent dehydrogenase (short-subunit alcohol dehydrogenase family)
MVQDRKVAIVTGASRGIGSGVVEGLRARGYRIVANARNIEPSKAADLVTVAGNIGKRETAEKLVAAALDRFGRIDTLINNAGIFIGKPFTEYTAEDFARVFETNIAGFFHVTQLALPQMVSQKSGHIVQISTTLVDQPLSALPSGLAALSKGGLDAVTRELAIEYASRGIRVNAVAPGVIKTSIFSPEQYESQADFLNSLHPVGRMGEVADIVRAILYLEDAQFVTGQTLNVDGGQTAGRW